MNQSTLTIEQVTSHFQKWRNTRARRTRIPEPLWTEATSLHPSYPIANIVKALRLCRSDFEKRLEHSGEVTTTEFVSISLDQTAITSSVGATVELERGDGSRLRIQQVNDNALLSVIDHYLRG